MNSKESFLLSIIQLAEEVWRFHEEFNIPRLANQMEVRDILRKRLSMLLEEFGEHAGAMNKDRGIEEVCEELADILFVAIGSVHSAGLYGEHGLNSVSAKNSHKTLQSHYMDLSGKILRRDDGNMGEGS